MAVRTQRERHARGQPAWQVAQPVAEVGFGAGAQDHTGATGGDGIDFMWHGVRGMHQLPARVQRQFLGQPLDGPRAGAGHTVVDLGHLLGDVDVDGRTVALQRAGQFMQRSGPRGAQGMHGHAGLHARELPAPDVVAQAQHAVDGSREAALLVAQCGLLKAGAFVQYRQQRQAHAHGGGGLRQGAAHGQRVGAMAVVGPAVGRVVQVVEFADLRVAAGQQFGVQVLGHRAHLLGRDAQRHAVHAVAPTPEVVMHAVAAFGQAHEGALKGVAVGVHKAGQRRAGQVFGLVRRGRVRPHLGPAAVGADAQQHVLRPGAVQPGVRRPQQRTAHSGRQAISACTSWRSSGCTAAARSSCHWQGGASSM